MAWQPPASDFEWQPPESDFGTSSDKPSQPTIGESLVNVGKRVLGAPAKVVQNLTPENMSPYAPLAGVVAGTALGGPLGGAAGAGIGQIASRMADIGYGRVQPGEAMSPMGESIAPMVQTGLAALPDVSGVIRPGVKTLSQSIGKGLAKTAETLTGVKRDIYEQAAKQGVKTYSAPSLPKAQEIFGKAIGPEGRAAMKESAEEAFDPALGKARAKAVEVATKIEKGDPVSAIEALQARQATDRVISATSMKDKMARRSLFDWRSKFDEIMTSQSGAMKSASDTYRRAIVKDKLLSPTRLNKGGEPSAFLPMMAGIAGITGATSRDAGTGIKAGIGYAAASSPMLWGLGAVTMGAISPNVRRALLTEFISRITISRQGQGGQQ